MAVHCTHSVHYKHTLTQSATKGNILAVVVNEVDKEAPDENSPSVKTSTESVN